MPRRPPLTPKQIVLVLAVLACLQTPLILFIIYLANNPKAFSSRQIAVMGFVNIFGGVSLLALITEKWIRKL
jgi:hypothetical protein